MKKLSAIILMAGRGRRSGLGKPKQFLTIAGKPLFLYSLNTFLYRKDIQTIVLVCPPDESGRKETLKHLSNAGLATDKRIRLAAGGSERWQSVLAGMELCAECNRVLIHDSARALLSRGDLNRIITASDKSSACILPASEVTDTIKHVNLKTKQVKNLNREELAAASTPQCLPYNRHLNALREMTKKMPLRAPTDDAEIYLKSGGKVEVCWLNDPNPKLTTPADVQLFKSLISKKKDTV